MNLTYILLLISVAVFFGMAIMPYFGYRIALWQSNHGYILPDNSSVVTVMSALFALLGLLIAFTFFGAFSRFDARRHILVEEVNNIGTAWLRLEMLAEEDQPRIKNKFREYVHSRSRLFPLLVDRSAVIAELENTHRLQNEIWDMAVAMTEEGKYRDTRHLLFGSLNQMFDITTVRTVAVQTHPPKLIFIVLVVVALVCSGMVGYSANTSKRYRLSSVHVVGFAGVIAFVLYVILDVEFPRYGFITLESVNNLFYELAQGMES